MRDPNNPERHLTTRELKTYRRALFDKQDGICHWCKGEMVFHEACPPGQNVGNVATFEHLEDSFSINGRNSYPGSIVLSCSTCNGKRNKEQEARVIATLKAHFGTEHHKVRRGKSIQETVQWLRAQGIEPLE